MKLKVISGVALKVLIIKAFESSSLKLFANTTLKCLFAKRNSLAHLSKAMFLVSRHVLMMGDVRRLSTSFLLGVMDPKVKRFMCWEISNLSVVTNLSSWLISMSSAQPPVSGGKGTVQVEKLRVKSWGYIVYQIRVFLHSAGVKRGDGIKIIFYMWGSRIQGGKLSKILKF